MKRKKASIILKIVVFALIVGASVKLIDLQSKIDTARAKQEALQQQVTDKETSNTALKYDIDHSTDQETIAEVARDDLGYVAPGEKVFYPTGD